MNLDSGQGLKACTKTKSGGRVNTYSKLTESSRHYYPVFAVDL